MNSKSLRILKVLLKNGSITRKENPELWSGFDDAAVLTELEALKRELDFDIFRVGMRAYLVPNQENKLFLQNNWDFRRDIKAQSDFRTIDLYILNYLAIYLLVEFFHGEGAEPLTRDFISKQEFVRCFTQHCEQVTSASAEKDAEKYSINFIKLADQWQSKLYGEPDDRRFDTQMGCLNRILGKFDKENLFVTEEEKIKPTQKCKDLMPFFLRKDRISAIHSYLNGGIEDAAAK